MHCLWHLVNTTSGIWYRHIVLTNVLFLLPIRWGKYLVCIHMKYITEYVNISPRSRLIILYPVKNKFKKTWPIERTYKTLLWSIKIIIFLFIYKGEEKNSVYTGDVVGIRVPQSEAWIFFQFAPSKTKMWTPPTPMPIAISATSRPRSSCWSETISQYKLFCHLSRSWRFIPVTEK